MVAVGGAAVVGGMLQAGAADVELRLAAGVAAIVGRRTAGRAVEVDCGAVVRQQGISSAARGISQ